MISDLDANRQPKACMMVWLIVDSSIRSPRQNGRFFDLTGKFTQAF